MYRFSLILVLTVACTRDLPPDSRSDKHNADSVENEIVPESVLTESITWVDAEIRVTYSNSFCNGYAPSEEMLHEIREPRPLDEIALILKGETDFYFTTDKRGRAELSLPVGNYELFLDRENDAETAPYNTSCQAYYDQSWGSLIVEEGITGYKIHIAFPCDLCDESANRRP